MLEESLRPPSEEKRVWLGIRQIGLRTFLEVLLREWQYLPCNEYVADGLLLAEEGSLEPPPNQQTIWLSASAYAARGRLRFPLDITDLYALLERRYHHPPRRHLRLMLNAPCLLTVSDQQLSLTIASLSDRGCRLTLETELARDVAVELRFVLAGSEIILPSRVIYCVPRYHGNHQLYYDLGLLFADVTRKQRTELLDYIIASYFLKVKARLSPDIFAEALGCFSVSAGVRDFLATA